MNKETCKALMWLSKRTRFSIGVQASQITTQFSDRSQSKWAGYALFYILCVIL